MLGEFLVVEKELGPLPMTISRKSLFSSLHFFPKFKIRIIAIMPELVSPRTAVSTWRRKERRQLCITLPPVKERRCQQVDHAFDTMCNESSLLPEYRLEEFMGRALNESIHNMEPNAVKFAVGIARRHSKEGCLDKEQALEFIKLYEACAKHTTYKPRSQLHESNNCRPAFRNSLCQVKARRRLHLKNRSH